MGPYAAPTILPPPSSGWRSVLSVIWTLAVVGVFVFLALNFTGLFLSPSYVVPGIQNIGRGRSANPDLSAGTANWSFQALGSPGATSSYDPTGGNPGGALQMTLPAGSNVGGEWVQAVDLIGTTPWLAQAQLDYQVQAAGSLTGRLIVSVESAATGLGLANATTVTWVNASAAGGTTAWTTTPVLDMSASIVDSGHYYLKVAFLPSTASGTTVVRFDNVKMGWVTDAAYYFYVPLPLPVILYAAQDQAGFHAYYGFLIVVLVVAAAWYSLREGKLISRAFTAPLENIRARLRSGSGWVAIAQVWMATTFFSVAFVYLLEALGAPTTSPISLAPRSAWVTIFDLTAATVYEELTFRVLLIGVPMALGAVLFRAARGSRPPIETVSGGHRASPLAGLRYLWGGQLRWTSSREAKLVAVILIIISSFLWAVAHAAGGGWGWWKVVPVFIAGLGAGYVFVRYGFGGGMVVQFLTDGSLALYVEGVGGMGMDLLTSLLELALAAVGAGFFLWYLRYGWEELRNLRRSFGPHVVRQAGPAGPTSPPPAAPLWNQGYAGPTPGAQQPPAPNAPPPPPPMQTWGAPPPSMAPATRRDPRFPLGYPPTYHPAPYGYPPVRFQCPFCGWVEAKYDNRHFTCLRCGRTA